MKVMSVLNIHRFYFSCQYSPNNIIAIYIAFSICIIINIIGHQNDLKYTKRLNTFYANTTPLYKKNLSI